MRYGLTTKVGRPPARRPPAGRTLSPKVITIPYGKFLPRVKTHLLLYVLHCQSLIILAFVLWFESNRSALNHSLAQDQHQFMCLSCTKANEQERPGDRLSHLQVAETGIESCPWAHSLPYLLTPRKRVYWRTVSPSDLHVTPKCL